MTRVIFAGGGTAGHVEPALAVAREWRRNNPDSDILFLGTKTGLETRLVPDAGFSLSLISKVKIARTFSPSLFIAPLSLIRTVIQCTRIIRKADLLVGFGGYVSAPAYVAAALTRTPFVIHEANARPGIANKIGAKLTPFRAIAHPVSRGALSGALLTGLPLREEVGSAYRAAESDWQSTRCQAKKTLGFSESDPVIFIFGGSQGSQAINAVIDQAKRELVDQGFCIFHGVGAKNALPTSVDGYRAENYIQDMATAYLAADIIISRSGAVTCAEVNTLGKFALFIPLPIGNGEQELNALDLVSQSRAEVIPQKDFTTEWLLSNIERLFQKSQAAPAAGSSLDMQAATKIVALMDHALSGGK